ncbi:RNA polymerase II transcription factor [Pseudozyma hubeiensis]|nr:RNA polymerase II transcription factor [Pseudozyma hubeiensis]
MTAATSTVRYLLPKLGTLGATSRISGSTGRAGRPTPPPHHPSTAARVKAAAAKSKQARDTPEATCQRSWDAVAEDDSGSLESPSMLEKDMRPNRFDVTLQYAREFVGEYFDQNPIGQLDHRHGSIAERSP